MEREYPSSGFDCLHVRHSIFQKKIIQMEGKLFSNVTAVFDGHDAAVADARDVFGTRTRSEI